MSRKENDFDRRNKVSRVVSILNMIGDGLEGEELIKRVEERESSYRQAEEKGNDSEARVADFLEEMKQYGWIYGYEKEEKGNARDMSGIDFKVEIANSSGILGLGHVWVQTKSSEWGRESFVTNGGGKRTVVRKRIVVVNGQLGKEDMFTQFWEGVVDIAKSKGWRSRIKKQSN